MELGPKDMTGGCVMLARRDTGAKETVAWGDLAARVPALLLQIQVLKCPAPGGGCCAFCGSV